MFYGWKEKEMDRKMCLILGGKIRVEKDPSTNRAASGKQTFWKLLDFGFCDVAFGDFDLGLPVSFMDGNKRKWTEKCA